LCYKSIWTKNGFQFSVGVIIIFAVAYVNFDDISIK